MRASLPRVRQCHDVIDLHHIARIGAAHEIDELRTELERKNKLIEQMRDALKTANALIDELVDVHVEKCASVYDDDRNEIKAALAAERDEG